MRSCAGTEAWNANRSNMYDIAWPLASAIISAASGLGGALIGSRGAIASQDRAQALIADRELTERTRREERTAAVFRAMLQRVGATILHFQRYGKIPDNATMDVALNAIREAAAMPVLLQDLTPIQISKTFSAIATADTIGSWYERVANDTEPKPSGEDVARILQIAIVALLEASETFPKPE
jgi:hypothetical protein